METTFITQGVTQFKHISLQRAAVIIPTMNASRHWDTLQGSLGFQGISPDQVVIIDSSSFDATPRLAEDAGYHLLSIPRSDFGHGKTRQLAAAYASWADILIYLTQDAFPSERDSLQHLVDSFVDPSIGAVYGRQLPRSGATPIECHARLFNYPDKSYVRSFEDRSVFGFRTVFFSNSFAAYHRRALEEVGGFSPDALVSEEVSVVARMLVAGWKVAYNADATVIHSHQLSIAVECARYFDIAVQHERERWIVDTFGSVGNYGRKFAVSQFEFLLRRSPLSIPGALARILGKWCAYQIGRKERLLPVHLKRLLSAQPYFQWTHTRSSA